MTKRAIMIGLAVMTTLLALVVLWQFRTVVIFLLVSLTLAAALRPLVKRLGGRSLPERVAWILFYLAALSGFGFFLFLAGEAALREIQKLAQSVAVQDKWQMPAWLEGSSNQRALLMRLPPPTMLFEALMGDQGQFVPTALLGFTYGVGGMVSRMLVILFLSLYWSIDQIHFERLWLSLLPSGQRKQARGVWRTVETVTGAYVRGQIIQSVLAGVLLWLGYVLLGSPYPALLALIGALASFIPVVGLGVALVPPLLVGLLTGVQLSFLTTVYTLLVLAGLGIWVKPRLFDRRWNNPMLTAVLLIALADAFGLFGILVAPLLSLVCQILWSRLVSHPGVSGAAAQVSDLKERQALVWEAIQAMDEPPLPLVTSSMQRLTQLIDAAEPILQAGLPGAVSAGTVPQDGVPLAEPSQPVQLD